MITNAPRLHLNWQSPHRGARLWPVALVLACVALACAEPKPAKRIDSDAATQENDAGQAPGPDGGPTLPGDSPDAPKYLTALSGPSDYSRLAGAGSELKFVLPTTSAVPAPLRGADCVFQNTARFPFHFEFMRTQPGWETLDLATFDRFVYEGSPPTLWAGSLKPVLALKHPIHGEAGTLLFSVSRDQPLTEKEVLGIARSLGSCAPYAAPTLAFVPLSAAQLEGFDSLRTALAKQGIAAISPNELSLALGGKVYSPGEGYGFLRLPTATNPQVGRRDIVVFSSAPPDLGIVAGVVSELPQSLHSHLNLRLKEKQIPNASLPGILSNPVLQSLEGSLVRLVANENGTSLEPTTLAAAQVFWDKVRPEIGALTADLKPKTWRSYRELRASDAPAFGSKAANLGELYQILPAENRVRGFGIPFSEYATFIAQAALTNAIETTVSALSTSSNALGRASKLKVLRNRIRQEALPKGFIERLQSQVSKEFGEAGLTMRLRFRSSTNAEDLRAFSGAGLYDSRSGCLADDLDDDQLGPSRCLTPAAKAGYEAQLAERRLALQGSPEAVWLAEEIADLEQELTEEKSAVRAVLRVWSSLWNDAAYDEREFYGLVHQDAFMAIAVQPAESFERLEAVALTQLSAADGSRYFRLASQVGEVGVVAPSDPGASPEIVTFHRPESGDAPVFLRIADSNLAQGPLYSKQELQAIAGHLFTIQDHFQKNVYPELSPLRLDIELKITQDGALLFKQARPYHSSN